MARTTVSRRVDADPTIVWEKLADLASHASWMRDARAIRFTSEERTGVGTTMEVETRIGPFTTTDVVEVTEWVPGRAIGVTHRGLVKGSGLLSMRRDDSETVVIWEEDLVFPWWLCGRFVAPIASAVLRRVWRGNLGRLAAQLEGR